MEDWPVGKTHPDWENLIEETGFRHQGGLDCNLNYCLTAPNDVAQGRPCDFSSLSKKEEKWKNQYIQTDKCCVCLLT